MLLHTLNKFFNYICINCISALTKIKLKLKLKKIYGINVREYLFRTSVTRVITTWNNNINKR